MLHHVLTVEGPGTREEIALENARFTIGRASENNVVLRDPKVSRHHALLEWTPLGWKIAIIESGNGIKVNGQPSVVSLLKEGDIVSIGETLLTLGRKAIDPVAAGGSSGSVKSPAPGPASSRDRTVRMGSGRYLLLIGGPLRLGLCGWTAGLIARSLLAGMVRPPLPPASFAGVGLLIGFVLGLQVLVVARSLAAARAHSGLILSTCAITLILLLAAGRLSGTLLGHLVSSVPSSNPARAFSEEEKSLDMKLLIWKFAPGGPPEETLPFCRALGTILAGLAALVLCSNMLLLIAFGERLKRRGIARTPTTDAPAA